MRSGFLSPRTVCQVYKIVAGHLDYYTKYFPGRAVAMRGRADGPGLSSTEIVRHAWLLNVNTQLSLLVKNH